MFIILNFNNSNIFLLSMLVFNLCQIFFPSSILGNVLPPLQLKKKKLMTSAKSAKCALESSTKYRLSYTILQECKAHLQRRSKLLWKRHSFFTITVQAEGCWHASSNTSPLTAVEWTDEAWKIF